MHLTHSRDRRQIERVHVENGAKTPRNTPESIRTVQKEPELSNSPTGSAREHTEQPNRLGYHADVSSARADAPGIGNNTQTGRKTSECSESTRERKTHPKCSKSSDPGLLDDNVPI